MTDATPTSDPPSDRDVFEALSKVWWLPLLRGIFLIILGVYAFLLPGMTMASLAAALGILLVIDGILCILAGVTGETVSRGWTLGRGVISILVGIFVFMFPLLVAGVAGATLIFLVAFGAILTGGMEIVAAIQDRKEIEGEGWLILSGVLSVVFGMLLLMAPLFFGMIMVRVLGVFAVILGISLITFAFRVKGFHDRIKTETPA